MAAESGPPGFKHGFHRPRYGGGGPGDAPNLRDSTGALGNILIGRRNVVVSSRQHARKRVPTAPVPAIALMLKS